MSDTTANPKAFHLSEGDAHGFSDAGDRVAVTWPHDEPENFKGELLDAGFNPIDAALAAKIHEAFLTRFAATRTAEMMRMILARIAQTKTGKSPEYLAIISIFSPGQSLDDIAADAGISRQAIHYHVKRLRPILTPAALVGDDDVPADKKIYDTYKITESPVDNAGAASGT